MSDPVDGNPDVEQVVPDDERFVVDDERSAPSPGIEDERETAPDRSDAGEEPSLQEHHDPMTTEDTASGGAPEP